VAEGTEVHPEESAHKAGDKGVKPTGKMGGWVEKHKTIAYGGMALVLVLLYLFMKKGGSASSAGTTAAGDNTAAQSGIDPATGYLYGSPADMAALGSSGTSASTPSGDDGSDGSTTTTNNYYSGTGTGTTTSGTSSSSSAPVNGSWTDTGQKWTLNDLAKKLGVPVSSLVATNRLGTKAASNPNAPIAKGAKVDIKR
jgi:hypothetical protein